MILRRGACRAVGGDVKDANGHGVTLLARPAGCNGAMADQDPPYGNRSRRSCLPRKAEVSSALACPPVERFDSNARRFQRAPDRGRDFHRLRRVAMTADAVDGGFDPFAGLRDDGLGLHHLDHTSTGKFRIMDHRAGYAAIDQSRVIIIGPVGKNLAGKGCAQTARGPFLSGGSQHHHDGVGVRGEGSLVAAARHVFILGRHIPQRAVQFHVPHRRAQRIGHAQRRADLNPDRILEGCERHRDPAAAKPLNVSKTGMRANPHPLGQSNPHCLGHDIGVTRVSAAGDVGRCDRL
mmetsp:Transcript_29737/g.59168  ORF Transcript_29737/g.59168 Transcript_29737/m.59168 type:complete len:293 (-) Transcript_29737:4196-5074(-)